MSKSIWGRTSNREPTEPKSKEQKEKDQISTLYELGLLCDSDNRPRRVKDKDQDQVRHNGGDRVAGSRSKKGTQ